MQVPLAAPALEKEVTRSFLVQLLTTCLVGTIFLLFSVGLRKDCTIESFATCPAPETLTSAMTSAMRSNLPAVSRSR